MPFTLTELRSDLDAALANSVDASTWGTALKDQAVREALLIYSLHGPAYEADLPVTTAGHEQDLGALPNLLAVEVVAYPWHDGLLIEDQAVRWRMVGATRLRVDRVAPQVGETLRVRYRRIHSVAGLDGAAATTVPDSHRATLALGATAAALGLRLRQMSENPAIPREAAAGVEAVRRERAGAFEAALERLQGEVRSPVWAGVGL
jgi:hypothetical protein